MRRLVIIGAGGFAREVAWLVDRINHDNPQWELLGFLDDNKVLCRKLINGYKVLGSISWLKEQDNEIYTVCAVGSADTRKKIINIVHSYENPNVKFANLIDPSVIISDFISMGIGTIICAASIITTNIEFGNFVIVNLDCTIGHDAILFDFVTLYPGVNISGNTIINTCVEIGTGSQVIQGIKIGENTIVGAGAVVAKNIPSNCTAVGIPAKPIKFRN